MKNKIVIAGYGPVGSAHEILLKRNIIPTQIVDPDYYRKLGGKETFNGRVYDYNPQALIVCVATPSKDDGSCDVSNVIDVLEDIIYPIPVLIKSTISIEGWEKINKKFPNLEITYSPEYLTSENSIDDLLEVESISLGGGNINYWVQFWNSVNKKTYIRDPKELITAKNFKNAFLATKVTFFNQIYDYCKANNLEFEQVRQEIANDNRIGASHSHVTKQRGYGGHCLPKDVKSILNSAKQNKVDLNILQGVVKYNEKVRKNA